MKRRLWSVFSDGALLLVLAIVLVNAYAISGEISAGRFDLNDSVFHYTLTDRMAQAISRGENPLDCWVSEWSLGYPVPRTYQVLGHLALAVLYVVLGKSVSILTLFVWARFLLVALLPLTVYASARLLMLPRTLAVACAVVSPLFSTNGLFGLEYGAYLWRGNGLFTQALAMHLLLLTIGYGFRAVRGMGSAVRAGVFLGLTFLAHFIYGFIGAISLVVLVFIVGTMPAPRRLVRIVTAGAVAFAVAAFQLVPMWMDGFLINHSRWEPQWKWDSFGAVYVFQNLFRGDLFDFGRLPALSILGLCGAVICVLGLRKRAVNTAADDIQTPSSTYRFLLAGATLWILLFCGRPAWGVLFAMLGAHDIQLHRLIGGVHAFGFFLIGIGMGTIWQRIVNSGLKYRYALAALAGFAILFPALRERRLFLQQNNEWSQTNLAALNSQAGDVETAITSLNTSQGRVYSGKAATWGNQLRVGSVPFYGILSIHHVPEVSFLYHAMALTSDLMVWFDEVNPVHYRLFNVSAVVAPAAQNVAPYLKPQSAAGNFRVYQAPANGYFDIVRVPYAVRVHPEDFYDLNYAWLKSDWAGRLNHLLLDTDGKTGSSLPRMFAAQSLPAAEDAFDLGVVSGERREREVYEATTEVSRPAYLLFKMTYHPNWRAVVDGVSEAPVMLTPGFMGVPLKPGRHEVRFQYEPGYLKAALLALGALMIGGAVLFERRGGIELVDDAVERAVQMIRVSFDSKQLASALTALDLLALALPVCVPLLTSQLVSGHDAFAYAPRLVEFHENIRTGVFLPRWAPDLGNGYGQPLFLYTPPLIYYLAEIWYLLGFQATTSYNLACVVIILASAGFMYLLGRFYFGRAGGWVAAAAYIYAPYFHVDLYVRQALAEFAAFPFYPLALYGFGRFVRDRDRRFLLVGALGVAGVLLAHNAAALLFAPILVAFILFNAWSVRSWKALLELAGAAALGVMLSAFTWLPILTEMSAVHIDRMREGYLNYSNHMVDAQQFFSAVWGFGLSLPGHLDGMSFSLGWPHVLLFVLAVVLLKRQRPGNRGLVTVLAAISVIYCFAMTPASVWLWDRLTLLQRVQFPWRMLGPVSACVALVVASATDISDRMRRGGVFALVLGSLIALNLGHIGAERYYRLAPQDWTPDQIAQRGVSVTTSEEYEPRSVLTRPGYQAEKLRVISGDAKISGIARKPDSWIAQINASHETVIEASLFGFPGWTAIIDGREVPTRVSVPAGLIQTTIPAGEHSLKLEFRRTTGRFYGELISALGLLIAVGLLFRLRRLLASQSR